MATQKTGFSKETRAFIQGYACALATLIKSHGMSVPIMEAFSAGIGSFEKMRKCFVASYDYEILEKYQHEFERWQKNK